MSQPKRTSERVLYAHAAVSVVLIIAAVVLYVVHSLDLTTALGLIGIAITLVGGNATAILAGAKYAERRNGPGGRIIGETHETATLPASHTVTVESRTTMTPEPPPATPAGDAVSAPDAAALPGESGAARDAGEPTATTGAPETAPSASPAEPATPPPEQPRPESSEI